MIQLDPGNRLGHNLESIKILKTHPFFNGVDFTQISKRNYKGLLPIVEKLIPAHLGKLNDAEELKRQSLMNVGMGMDFNPLFEQNKVILKGNLVKKNWYGSKQIRFFELYQYGELKYYKDMKDYKGSITLGPNTKIRKTQKTTINIFCEKKKKEYVLI